MLFTYFFYHINQNAKKNHGQHFIWENKTALSKHFIEKKQL